jgi:molecular chaperone DnaJ
VLRLKGKGLPHLQSYGRGDLLVNVNIWVPQILSREERTMLEKLNDSPNFAPDLEKTRNSFFARMKDYFQR